MKESEFIERAQALYAEGDLSGAIVELQNALQEYPHSVRAHWILGQVHLEIGDGGGAEHHLLQAMQSGIERE